MQVDPEDFDNDGWWLTIEDQVLGKFPLAAEDVTLAAESYVFPFHDDSSPINCCFEPTGFLILIFF
jgi:hypothetical protein